MQTCLKGWRLLIVYNSEVGAWHQIVQGVLCAAGESRSAIRCNKGTGAAPSLSMASTRASLSQLTVTSRTA